MQEIPPPARFTEPRAEAELRGAPWAELCEHLRAADTPAERAALVARIVGDRLGADEAAADGVVPLLGAAMRAHAGSAAVQASGCRALRLLLARAEDGQRRGFFAIASVLPPLVTAMRAHADCADVQAEACAALHAAAAHDADARQLVASADLLPLVEAALRAHAADACLQTCAAALAERLERALADAASESEEADSGADSDYDSDADSDVDLDDHSELDVDFDDDDDADADADAAGAADAGSEDADVAGRLPIGELVEVDCNGVPSGHAHALYAKASVSIGRAPGSRIRVELGYAASTHCRVQVNSDQTVTLRNASASGTYVNGKLVCNGLRRRLAFGDQISFVEPRHASALGQLLYRTCALAPCAESDDGRRLAPSALDAQPGPRADAAAAAARSGQPSAQPPAPDGDAEMAALARAAAVGAPAQRPPRVAIGLGSFSADVLRSILARLDDDDLVNARLACTAFREHLEPPTVKRRAAYLRTRALCAYAREALPGYVLANTHVLWRRLQVELDVDASTEELDLSASWASPSRKLLDKLLRFDSYGQFGQVLVQVLYRLPLLQALKFSPPYPFSYDAHVGLEGTLCLAKWLTQSGGSRLTSLDLSSNGAGPDAIRALAQGLEHHRSLARLDLSCNKLGHASAAALAEVLPSMRALSSLSLYDNVLGDAGTVALAQVLPAMGELSELFLADNQIAGEGAAALAMALPSTRLRAINLFCNPTGNRGAIAFARALPRSPGLEFLSLGGNEIGGKGAAALAKALPSAAGLQQLILKMNPIGHGLKAQLRAAAGPVIVDLETNDFWDWAKD